MHAILLPLAHSVAWLPPRQPERPSQLGIRQWAVQSPQLTQAPARLDVLLVDHANCEKKAASTALGMLYRYVDRPELLYRLSRLAPEELRHFEQVCALMAQQDVAYGHRGNIVEARHSLPTPCPKIAR